MSRWTSPGGARGERAGDVAEVREPRRERYGRVAYRGAERAPLHQLHDDVGRAVELADVEDGDRVGVIEGRRGARLPDQPALASAAPPSPG